MDVEAYDSILRMIDDYFKDPNSSLKFDTMALKFTLGSYIMNSPKTSYLSKEDINEMMDHINNLFQKLA